MFYKTEETVPTEYYLTYDQMNVINAFEKLWLHIAFWMGIYTRAALYDTPNLKPTANQLTNLPSEFYGPFSIFYGTEIAQSLVDLMSKFMQSAMGVIEVMKYGDQVLLNSRVIEWYNIADELSSFLAKTNVYWDENQWRYLLYQLIKLKIDEASALLNNDNAQEISLYNQIENIIFLIASYMARGILASSSLQRIPPQSV